MIEGLASFIGAVKQAGPLVAFAIALAAGTVIFAPDTFVTSLGLIDFRDQQRALLGGAFLLASAIVLANVAQKIGVAISNRYKKHRKTKVLHGYLDELTPEEKGYLEPYVLGDVNTQMFKIDDGIAMGLEQKSILFRPSNMFDLLEGAAFNIQPWAKNRLRDNPKLLEGAITKKKRQGPRYY